VARAWLPEEGLGFCYNEVWIASNLRMQFLEPKLFLKLNLGIPLLSEEKERWAKSLERAQKWTKWAKRRARVAVAAESPDKSLPAGKYFFVEAGRVYYLPAEGESGAETLGVSTMFSVKVKEVKKARRLEYLFAYAFSAVYKRVYGDHWVWLSNVEDGDEPELTLRGVQHPRYHEQVLRYKRLAAEGKLEELPVFHLLLLRPPWLNEVAEGVVLYYLNRATDDERKLTEEFLLRTPDWRLTAPERSLKRLVEREKPLELEGSLLFTVKRVSDRVWIETDEGLAEEVERRLRVWGLGRFDADEFSLPAEAFDEYARLSTVKKDEAGRVTDLLLLSRLWGAVERGRLRLAILSDGLVQLYGERLQEAAKLEGLLGDQKQDGGNAEE